VRKLHAYTSFEQCPALCENGEVARSCPRLTVSPGTPGGAAVNRTRYRNLADLRKRWIGRRETTRKYVK
jgi:hypothetical protein